MTLERINIQFVKLFILMLVISSAVNAQQVPFLLSPGNNARYVKTDKLVLEWLSVPGAEAYQVQVAEDESFNAASIVADERKITETATISGLKIETSYWWRVRVNEDSALWSEIRRFTTTGFARPVTLISPSDGSDNLMTDVVVFEWSKDSANATFNLQLAFDPEFSDTLRSLTNNRATAELTNLASGRQFYWRVKPYNIDGVPGEWTEVFGFRTELRKPVLTFPSNFSNNRDTSITFRWSEVNLASIYDFQVSTAEEFDETSLFTDTATTFNRIKIDGMLHDSVYYWRVKARNAFTDSSRWSEPFTFKTKLQSPLLLTPANHSRNISTQVKLEWIKSNPFETYRVQVATDTTFKQIHTDAYSEQGHVTLLNLENNKYYYWRVNLRNGVGDTSYWSDYSSFKTILSKPILASPNDNSVQLSENISFSWHPVDSADTYSLQVAESPGYEVTTYTETTGDTSIIIESLDINRNYYWRVRAGNEQTDTSLWSESYSLHTSRFSLSALSIDTTINFSRYPDDTVSSFMISNYSDEPVTIHSISAFPDTLFYIAPGTVSIQARDSQKVTVIVDTINLTAGLSQGRIALVSDPANLEDTLWMDLNLFARMAVGGFSTDSLVFDTTNSSAPKSKSIQLNNRLGNTALEINEIVFEGEEADAFQLLNEVEIIGAEDSVNLNIKFDPVELGNNNASIVIHTNSFPDRIIRLPISGPGKGGRFSDNTITSLREIENYDFKSITNDKAKITFQNTGHLPLEYQLSFAENYFRIIDRTTNTYKIQPGDTSSISLHYITPNYDSLNTDTLLLNHNAVGKSPLRFPLNGSFDSTEVVNTILNSLTIEDQGIPVLRNGFTVPEGSSIRSRFSEDLFDNETNLEFRLNYFTGGPGNKKRAVKNNGRFIIPFQNVNASGLIITGELFSKGLLNQPVDSLVIFEPIDVRVAVNNYKHESFTVPKSVAAESAGKTNTKWVLFGYPFETIIADSLFNDLGGVSKMEDGQWIVYEYNDNVSSSFRQFDSGFLNAGRAYFIAQSVAEQFDLSYTYDNTILSRALTDNKITLETGSWKTIANPYTFDVEVDTPAVLYKYDTEAGSYKLTNIMRPGEGYFVPPEISEISLITYGEYYPVLFPKIFAYSDWVLTIEATSNSKSEEVHLFKENSGSLKKQTHENLVYRKAPQINGGFRLSFVSSDKQDYSAALIGATNSKYKLKIVSGKKEEVMLNLAESGTLPPGFKYVLINSDIGHVNPNTMISLHKNVSKEFILLVGTQEYIDSELRKVSEPGSTEYNLSQNYPNPFNPETTIRFSLAANGLTRIVIYDILGREVAVLLNREMEAGRHSISFDASSAGLNLASGIYIYNIESNNFRTGRKMILLK